MDSETPTISREWASYILLPENVLSQTGHAISEDNQGDLIGNACGKTFILVRCCLDQDVIEHPATAVWA